VKTETAQEARPCVQPVDREESGAPGDFAALTTEDEVLEAVRAVSWATLPPMRCSSRWLQRLSRTAHQRAARRP
jgi:hypothetical protein